MSRNARKACIGAPDWQGQPYTRHFEARKYVSDEGVGGGERNITVPLNRKTWPLRLGADVT